jgi:hypothetical protein
MTKTTYLENAVVKREISIGQHESGHILRCILKGQTSKDSIRLVFKIEVWSKRHDLSRPTTERAVICGAAIVSALVSGVLSRPQRWISVFTAVARSIVKADIKYSVGAKLVNFFAEWILRSNNSLEVLQVGIAILKGRNDKGSDSGELRFNGWSGRVSSVDGWRNRRCHSSVLGTCRAWGSRSCDDSSVLGTTSKWSTRSCSIDGGCVSYCDYGIAKPRNDKEISTDEAHA